MSQPTGGTDLRSHRVGGKEKGPGTGRKKREGLLPIQGESSGLGVLGFIGKEGKRAPKKTCDMGIHAVSEKPFWDD